MDVLRRLFGKLSVWLVSRQDLIASSCTDASYVLLVLIVVDKCIVPLQGKNDVWSHMAVGKWIVEHGAVPRANLFTWHHQDYSWVAHSWLSGVIFYGLWCAGGTAALILLRPICLAAALYVARSIWAQTGAPRHLFPGFAFLALAGAGTRLGTRQELFSTILLMVEIKCLWDWKSKRCRSLLAFPFLFALWSNLHAAFAVGLAVLVVFALVEVLQELIARNRDLASEDLRWLGVATVCSVAASLCTPYGLSLFKAMTPEVVAAMRTNIDEWRSVSQAFRDRNLPWHTVVPCVAMFAWIAWSAVRLPERNYSFLAIPTLLCGFTLTSIRFIGLLAFACLAVSPLWMLQEVRNVVGNGNAARQSGDTGWQPLVVVCLLAFSIMSGGQQIMKPRSFGVDLETTPVGAAHFITRNALGERLYNPPNYAYLDWHFGATNRLFYDIQADYPPAFIFEAARAISLSLDPADFIQKWQFDLMIIPFAYERTPLARYVARSSSWALIYWDGADTVFVRRLPRHEHVIAEHEYRYANPFALKLLEPNEHELASREIERAIRSAPKTARLFGRAGRLYRAIGSYEKAEAMRRAVRRL